MSHARTVGRLVGMAIGSVLVPTQDDRLETLDFAIQENPQAAVNYLLRGEYWLAQGDIYQAQDDFLTVLALAHATEWTYISQAYRDRAEANLAQIERDGRTYG